METKEILDQREKLYGKFEMQALIAQELKTIIKHYQENSMERYKIEALEMILHKIARIINGDSNHIDSWIDIVGYSQLVVNILKRANKESF